MRIELENRLVAFAGGMIKFSRDLKKEFIAQHLTEQILRSSTSAALNYGEAQSAQTRKDFIHKISIVLKELRETHINLKIIQYSELCLDKPILDQLLQENNELIAIFTRTLQTARGNIKTS